MPSKLKVVIDTNVLLVSISSKSKYYWLYQAVLNKEVDVFVTNSILLEYEEKIAVHWNAITAKNVLRTLHELSNVHFINIHFRFALVDNDTDDNEFADCFINSSCHYLISNDKHLLALNKNKFPPVEVIKLDDFKAVL